MRARSASLLRRGAPLVAVLTLAAPAYAGGTATPDPAPGSAALQPDAAPTATPPSAPKKTPAEPPRTTPAPAPVRTAPHVVRAATPVVTQPAPAPVRPARTAPVAHHAKRRPVAPKPKPKALPRFEVPPIVLPHALLEPLDGGPSRSLAALAAAALALAALTAASGARLVAAWSRR